MENSDFEVVVGTCETMCPESEMRMRESCGRLHYFEKDPITRHQRRPKLDRDRAIKEFSRPAAGKKAVDSSDLRPAPVLQKTVGHLLDSIIPCTDIPWSDVYSFVFDRLRSVRQDMVIQCIHGQDAIVILEIIVRFHVYAGYRLSSESQDQFDSHINDIHLQECLKRLLVLYSTTSASAASNRAEFTALYLIVNLGSNEALSLGLQLKSTLRHNPVFTMALMLSLNWLNGNYVRTLCLVKKLPAIHLCAANRHLDTIRCFGLKVMSAAFAGKNLTYPLSSVVHLFLFDGGAEAEEFCKACGLILNESRVSFSRAKFHPPDQKPRPSSWIDERLEMKTLPEHLRGVSD